MRRFLEYTSFSTFSRRLPLVKLTVLLIFPPVLCLLYGTPDLLQQEVKSWWEEGYEIFVMCEGEERTKEIERLLKDYDFPVYLAGTRKEMLLELARTEMEAALEQNLENNLEQNQEQNLKRAICL